MTDGSHVTLNTDSAIRVAVTDRERSVQLERGEAFFDVARDPHRPFIVRAGDKRIVVLGTQFSVRRDGDEVRVAVAEGKVRLEDESGNASAAAIERSSKAGAASVGDARESLVLEAGGIARMGGQSVLVQSQPVPDVEDALSWRSGFVIFRNVDLAHAVAEFNRYNGRKIVIQDADVGDIRLSGKFKATNFDAFVRLLEEGFPITFRAPR
jgi:transmembrane sensor